MLGKLADGPDRKVGGAQSHLPLRVTDESMAGDELVEGAALYVTIDAPSGSEAECRRLLGGRDNLLLQPGRRGRVGAIAHRVRTFASPLHKPVDGQITQTSSQARPLGSSHPVWCVS